MIDREKVLKGLECCADHTGKLCKYCPYDFANNDNCMGDMARDALNLLKAQPQWISVEDRMPELRKAVLVYAPLYKNIWAVTLHEDGNWYYWSPITRMYKPEFEGPITHWMQLPEPPEGVMPDE